AQEEEQKIRRELGIGSHGKVTIDASTVEKLLEDALVGYEQVFAGTEFEPQPAEGDETRAAPPRPVGPALNVEDLLGKNLDLLKDVHMKVKVELGRGRMYLKDILRLDQGSVVELERLAGDPLEIYVNNKVIARGEVLVLNENFCIRITEIVNPAELLSQG
ncbi:MAG: flagellar motor switch protein FliN, partial [Planctomycetota bacterium]